MMPVEHIVKAGSLPVYGVVAQSLGQTAQDVLSVTSARVFSSSDYRMWYDRDFVYKGLVEAREGYHETEGEV